MKNRLILIPATLCLLIAAPCVTARPDVGIVNSVVNAPIVPDGDVAGARTDIVINLQIDMDPAVPGLTMAPGDQLRITLPDEFIAGDTVNFPIANVGSSPSCAPGNLQCTTGVLLQGWPQNPLSPATYDFDVSDNVVSYTATAAVGPNMFGPGLKQAHIIGNGIRNPKRPGRYALHVELERGGQVAGGTGMLRIVPNVRPSINVTSVFDVPPDDPNGGNPPNPNFIYQQTGPGQATPLIWNFLLWDTRGRPFTNVSVEQQNRHGGRLVVGNRTVGRYKILAPRDAMGQHLMSLGPSVVSGTPVIGMTFSPPLMTARLRAVFTAGSALGRYNILLRLNNGNSTRMVVDVVE